MKGERNRKEERIRNRKAKPNSKAAQLAQSSSTRAQLTPSPRGPFRSLVPAQQAHAQHPPPYGRSHLQLLTFFPPRSAPCFPDRVAPPVSTPPRGRSSNRTRTSLPASLLAPQLSVPRTLGPPAVDEHQKPASAPFTQPSRPTCQRLSHCARPSPSRPNPTWQPASPGRTRSPHTGVVS